MIKKTLTVLTFVLLLVSSTCKGQYPDLKDGLYAEIVTTKGIMVAQLHYNKVPVTVANFVALAEGIHPLVSDEFKGKPYYDGITFHRVIDKFMIQGGDHTASGSGNPGYKFAADFNSKLKHNKAGVLSMANSGGFNTNSSQFFITEVPYPSLDAFDANGNLKPCDQPRVSCHSVFGELVKGIEIQDSISNVKVINPATRNHKPIEDVIITKVNIIRKGHDAKTFDAAKVFEKEMPNVEANLKKIKEDQDAKAKALADAAKIDFLRKNKALKGRRIESPTGMAMIFTHESNGVKPNSNQRVNINCAGYFENGDLFWTTWKTIAENNGKYDPVQDQRSGYAPFDMPYNETASLVSGFREAILNMKIGDKVRVFIPYYLGYGIAGRAPLIPAKTNLVFDIELTSIKK